MWLCTNPILTDNANRVIQGNVATRLNLIDNFGATWWPNFQLMQLVSPGGQVDESDSMSYWYRSLVWFDFCTLRNNVLGSLQIASGCETRTIPRCVKVFMKKYIYFQTISIKKNSTLLTLSFFPFFSFFGSALPVEASVVKKILRTKMIRLYHSFVY